MPFSLKRTVLESSVKVSCQLELELDQFAIESSWEVTLKWLWQISELLLDENRFPLYLISDVRQTRDLSLVLVSKTPMNENSVPCANLFCQLLRKRGYQLCGAKAILVFAEFCGPRSFLTEIRLFLPSGCNVIDPGVRIVLDDIITKTQFVSLPAQNLTPLFERLSFLKPIGFRDD